MTHIPTLTPQPQPVAVVPIQPAGGDPPTLRPVAPTKEARERVALHIVAYGENRYKTRLELDELKRGQLRPFISSADSRRFHTDIMSAAAGLAKFGGGS